MITPLDESRRVQVVGRTHDYINRAERLFGISLSSIPVSFDLQGRTAGMFRIRNHAAEIRYNPWLFSRYYRENLAQTVPHEVAHYVVHCIAGRHRTRPHGREWQNVMTAFGVEPRIHCEFNMDGIPQRRLRRYEYICGCQTHQLTSIRHNRVVAGRTTYHCRQCRQPLRAIG